MDGLLGGVVADTRRLLHGGYRGRGRGRESPAVVKGRSGQRGVERQVYSDGEHAGAGTLGMDVELLAERPDGRQQPAAAVDGGVLAPANDTRHTALSTCNAPLHVGTEVVDGLLHVEAVEVDDVSLERRVVVSEDAFGGQPVVVGGRREKRPRLAGELDGSKFFPPEEGRLRLGEQAVAADKGLGGQPPIMLDVGVVGGGSSNSSGGGPWGSASSGETDGRRGRVRRRSRVGRGPGWGSSRDEFSVHGGSPHGAVLEALWGRPGRRRRPSKGRPAGARFHCRSPCVHACITVGCLCVCRSWRRRGDCRLRLGPGRREETTLTDMSGRRGQPWKTFPQSDACNWGIFSVMNAGKRA